jgi:hypothetical protein
VRNIDFGAQGTTIDIEIFAHIRTIATAEFLEIQEALILDIIHCLECRGIGVTCPPSAEGV